MSRNEDLSTTNTTSSPSTSFLYKYIFTPFLFKSFSVIGGLLLLIGGYLYIKQDTLLYFPEIGGIPRHNRDNPRGYRSPHERQIPFSEHQIQCSDGVILHAWLLFAPRPQPPTGNATLVFFHGNAGNIGLRLPNAMQMLQYLNVNVFLVEYRGYGDSQTVTPNEKGLKLDAEAALQYLHHNHPSLSIDPQKIFVFGRSLGGAVAFHLAQYAERHASQYPIQGIIVENTFTSISAMVDQLMPFLTPIKPFVLKIGWDSSRIAPTLTRTPILFLAGSNDQLVPHEHMLQLYQLSLNASKKLVELYVVKGGTHNETWMQGGHKYWECIQAFIGKVLSAEATSFQQEYYTTEAVADTVESSIPTMSNRFVDIAKEAITGKGVEAKDTHKKEL